MTGKSVYPGAPNSTMLSSSHLNRPISLAYVGKTGYPEKTEVGSLRPNAPDVLQAEKILL
jgi:hypothetical protein